MNNVKPIGEVKESYGIVNACGIVSNIKIIKVRKNNTTMAFIKLFDETDEMEVTVFPRIYDSSIKILNKNAILLIKGRYEHKNDKESFVADEIKLLEE